MRALVEQRQHAVDAEVAALLDDGLARLGLDAGVGARQAMLNHLEMLARWNRTMNLTAVADPLRAVIVHVLDSLSIAPHLAGPRVIDVGSGAGFPGLPLAFLRPDLEFTLLDSRDRKLRFVSEVLRATGTANVTLANERVERYFPAGKFDTLVARAFSSLADLVRLARHLVAPGARLLAMKGAHPQAELDALAGPDVRADVVPLEVPFLDARRHLVIIQFDESEER